MPIGDLYPSFQACVNDQMRKHKGQKGFTIDNARRICGFLQKKVGHKMREEKVDVVVMDEDIVYEQLK